MPIYKERKEVLLVEGAPPKELSESEIKEMNAMANEILKKPVHREQYSRAPAGQDSSRHETSEKGDRKGMRSIF